MNNYKTYYDKIISLGQALVTAGTVKRFDMYKGEYETNTDYDPMIPEVFIEDTGFEVKEYNMGGKVSVWEGGFTVWLAAQNLGANEVLSLVDTMHEWFDGKIITPTAVAPICLQVGNSKSIGYLGDGVKVYQFQVFYK